MHISAAEAGRSLAEVLRARLKLSWSQARSLIQSQQVRVNGKPCQNPGLRMQRGQRLDVRAQGTPSKQAQHKSPAKAQSPGSSSNAPRSRSKMPKALLRHVDEDIVVVDKPAGVTTMRHPSEAAEFGARGRRFLPPTLADELPALLADRGLSRVGRVRPVHRLDRDTSGLVVFALTPEAESNLGGQFRAHTVRRRYLAIVRGRAVDRRIESRIAEDRGDGRRGSVDAAGSGKRAVTHVRVVKAFSEFTLVECRLETGRTHQVRIHLGEAGTPICGERIYDRPLHGKPLPDHPAVPRLLLHAAELGFIHPRTGKELRWESPLPPDIARFLELMGDDKVTR